MESDLKIWDDFRKGEKYALSHIYHQHVGFLYQYGRKFSPNGDLVKDTIQDLFFDLKRTCENLGPTNNIRFYLMRSLRRKLVRNLEKEHLPVSEYSGGPTTTIVYSFEDELIDRENLNQRERLVQQCLQELNPRQREILYYRFTCNLEYDEICELMSLKYDSARKLVHRAIESLKRIFGENNFIQLFVMMTRYKLN